MKQSPLPPRPMMTRRQLTAEVTRLRVINFRLQERIANQRKVYRRFVQQVQHAIATTNTNGDTNAH